jgi:hypothetical protein
MATRGRTRRPDTALKGNANIGNFRQVTTGTNLGNGSQVTRRCDESCSVAKETAWFKENAIYPWFNALCNTESTRVKLIQ